MRSVAALALALALAAPAAAQPTTGTVVLPNAGRETVQIRTRTDAVGDTYRFRSDTTFSQRDTQGEQSQVNHQVFDLQVLGVTPDGLRLRYTLREAGLKDSGGASMSAALDAAVGGSLDFRVGRDGAPVALDNWPDYRTRLLARVDAALKPGDPVRAIIHDRMSQPPMNAAAEMVLGDVRLMAAMELRGRVPLGVSDLGGGPPPSKATLEVSVAKPNCVAAIKRETTRTVSNASQAAVTEADLSVADGRILSLSERRVTRAPGGSQTEDIRIRRVSPAPAC